MLCLFIIQRSRDHIFNHALLDDKLPIGNGAALRVWHVMSAPILSPSFQQPGNGCFNATHTSDTRQRAASGVGTQVMGTSQGRTAFTTKRHMG